jgi:ATP-binding cassette subfamily B protein
MLIALLRTHLAPYRRWLTAVVVLQLIGTIASLYLPSLNADIIDNGVAKGDTDYIMHTGGWMLAVSLVQIACSITAVYFGARTAMSVGRDLRGTIFRRVGEFSSREMAHFGAPSLITRNTNDVQQVQMLVVMTCTMMVMAPIMCVGGVIMALREDIGLAWVIAVSVPVLVTVLGLIIRRMVPQFREMQKRIDTVNSVLREQLAGIRVVRAFVREPAEVERFDDASTALSQTAVRAGRLMALLFPTVLLVANLSSIAVLWFGASRVASGQMQIGALTAFLAYLVQILMSVTMATMMLMMVPRATVSAERIQEVLNTESSVRPPDEPIRTAARIGDVEFREVMFQYPGASDPVLRGITLHARAGQTAAIIGSTGSGKSTLVSLIPRMFDVTSGSVRVDGVDVRELDPDLLWSRIGLVPQKAYLFSGTVASNLRYGNPDATDEELWHALDVAQAREFVAAMPGVCRPRSRKAAARCPADNGNAWRSRAPSSAGLRYTSSTRRSLRWTWVRTPGCGRRCGRRPARQRSSSWRNVCRRSWTPTRSRCWTTGRSWDWARTTNCCATARLTLRSSSRSCLRRPHDNNDDGPAAAAGGRARCPQRSAVDVRRPACREVDELRPLGAPADGPAFAGTVAGAGCRRTGRRRRDSVGTRSSPARPRDRHHLRGRARRAAAQRRQPPTGRRRRTRPRRRQLRRPAAAHARDARRGHRLRRATQCAVAGARPLRVRERVQLAVRVRAE